MVPNPLTLALQARSYAGHDETKLKKAFKARELGLVLGWTVLGIEDPAKENIVRNLEHELHGLLVVKPNHTYEAPLARQILQKMGHPFDESLLEGDSLDVNTLMQVINIVYADISNDRELSHTLNTHIPLDERADLCHGYMEMQCKELNFFRDNMLRWSKEGGMPPRLETPSKLIPG